MQYNIFFHVLIFFFRNQSGGRLHLVEGVGKIPLADITLIEDPNEEDRTDSKSFFHFRSNKFHFVVDMNTVVVKL